MKLTTAASPLALAGLTSALAATSQNLCQKTAFVEGGNWFCQAVDHIVYSNVGTKAGTYDDVVSMNQNTGECIKQPKPFSGGLAPFNEPMSVHIRGPFILNQFAVYTPSAGNAKRDELPSHNHWTGGHTHRHLHNKRKQQKQQQREEKRQASEAEVAMAEEEKRADHPVIWVTATINGKVVSWTNTYWGPSAAPDPNPDPSPAPAAASPTPAVVAAPVNPAPIPVQTSAAAAAAAPSAAVGSDFARTAYYDSSSGQATGLTFLANYGGQGSGKWTTTFGNTVSYVNAEGTAGSPVSAVLANTTIHSGNEIMIMTDKPCTADTCGYWQDGTVAYQGFPGGSSVFLYEFSMPHEQGATGLSADEPALWMLNSKIPRTSQYSACSCWASGCGEFDIFEVLAPGDTKAKSTIHSNSPGGDSNYFDRPVGASIKLAVVYDASSALISVKIIDSATDFAAGLSAAQVQAFANSDASNVGGLGTSLFAVAS